MGRLSTHVLDTAAGRPAAGVAISLHRLSGGEREQVAVATTNADGRTDAPLLEGDAFVSATYEIVFDLGGYFGAAGGFLGEVAVRFEADGAQNYHVPLLASPFGYTTYRGS